MTIVGGHVPSGVGGGEAIDAMTGPGRPEGAGEGGA